MRKVFFLVVIMLIGTIGVYAQTYEVEINLPESFMTAQEYNKAYFDVVIINKGEKNDFHIQYSRDDFDTVYDGGIYTVSENSKKFIRISDNLPKGSYILSVRVMSEDETVFASKRMAVLEKYKTQYMDDYSRIGTCFMHVGSPDVTSSNYKWFKETINKNIKLAEFTGFTRVRYTGCGWEAFQVKNGEVSYGEFPLEYIENTHTSGFLGVPIVKGGEALTTREQMEDCVDYTQKRIKYNKPHMKFFAELGNEPDLSKYFPGRDEFGIKYNNILRYIYLGIYEVSEDFSLIGGVTSGGTIAVSFLENMFAQDAYKYLDGISYHPYIKSSTVDKKYDSFSKPYLDSIEGKGGWLQRYITEIGWDSAWEGSSSIMNHEDQAVEVVKVLLKTYLNDLDATFYYSLVNNLGIQPINDFSVASAGIVASCNLTKMVNSAQYVGEFPMADGIMCAMFVRHGNPFIVVWMPGDEPIEFIFDTDVNVEDMYGNLIYTGDKITIDNQVHYISGFGDEYVFKTAVDVKNKAYDEVIEKYGDKFNSKVFEKAKAWIETNVSDNPLGMVNAHYDAGNTLIDEYIRGNTELELHELTDALHILHIAGEKLSNMYAMTVNTSATNVSEKYTQVKSKVDEIKGEKKYSTLLYTDKILKFARRFYAKAKEIQSREYNPMQAGVVTASSLVSQHLSEWAEKVMPLEELDDTIGILTITEPMRTQFYQSTRSVEVKYTLDNKRVTGIDGEIVVMNGDGEILGESIPVELGANEYKDIMIEVPNDYSNKESDMYKIKLIENGKVLNEKWFPVAREKVLDVELLPANSVFSNLGSIGVKLENNTPEPVKGNIMIAPPEGWMFENEEVEFALEAFESKDVYLNIITKKQVPYNIYSFDISVTQDDGTEFYRKKFPLNFPIIVKSELEYNTEEFNGDITDWSNAYPLFAGAPEDPDDKEQWRKSDVASITFYKYDDNYLYILANVYDNVFHGKYTGINMWRNDSMQMVFDPLNNAGSKLQSDDYAFFIGFTEAGYELSSNVGPNGASSSNIISYKNALRVIRDDNLNLTRYLVKLPFEAIAPLKGKQGVKFRTNICFNDSDVEDRNNVIQITKGVAEGGAARNPSFFYEFSMVGYERLGDIPMTDCWLDLQMEKSRISFR